MLLFAYPHYYPGGGWRDFVGEYQTISQAIDALEKYRQGDPDSIRQDWDSAHLIQNNTITHEFGSEPRCNTLTKQLRPGIHLCGILVGEKPVCPNCRKVMGIATEEDFHWNVVQGTDRVTYYCYSCQEAGHPLTIDIKVIYPET